jgi:hypothetical protein
MRASASPYPITRIVLAFLIMRYIASHARVESDFLSNIEVWDQSDIGELL